MTAISGAFSDLKVIKTRAVMQLVIEVPIEQADAALKALGGVPQPGGERWVGIALLSPEVAVAASGPGKCKPCGDSIDPDKGGEADRKGKAIGPREGKPEGVPVRSRGNATATPLTESEKARTRCAILCKDREFQTWIFHRALAEQRQIGIEGEREAECARLVREMLGITTRAEIAYDEAARAKFRQLEAAYAQGSGKLAEARG